MPVSYSRAPSVTAKSCAAPPRAICRVIGWPAARPRRWRRRSSTSSKAAVTEAEQHVAEQQAACVGGAAALDLNDEQGVVLGHVPGPF